MPWTAAQGEEKILQTILASPHLFTPPFFQYDIMWEPTWLDDTILMEYKESLKAILFPKHFRSITQQYLLKLTKEGSN